MLNSEVERKFIDTIDLSDWEILTDTGWENVNSVHKTIPYVVWRAEFTDGFFLEGADTHIVICEDGSECFLKDLKPGQQVWCQTGLCVCLSVSCLNIEESMYDVEIDSSKHLYFTNRNTFT